MFTYTKPNINSVHIYVRTSIHKWTVVTFSPYIYYWYLGVKQYNIIAFRKMSVLYVSGITYCNEKVENYKNYKS